MIPPVRTWSIRARWTAGNGDTGPVRLFGVLAPTRQLALLNFRADESHRWTVLSVGRPKTWSVAPQPGRTVVGPLVASRGMPPHASTTVARGTGRVVTVEDRCPHELFYSGAGACPQCGGGAS